MIEKWSPVVGYEGLYEVSNLGSVRSLPRKGTFGRILSADYSNAKHYAHIVLMRNGEAKNKVIHRLVAEAFIPNPENKPQVNHIDGDKRNNAASNLEWVTGQENVDHALATGLWPRKPEKAIEARSRGVMQKIGGEVVAMFHSVHDAQAVTGVCNQNIFKVCQGKRKTAGGYSWELA